MERAGIPTLSLQTDCRDFSTALGEICTCNSALQKHWHRLVVFKFSHTHFLWCSRIVEFHAWPPLPPQPDGSAWTMFARKGTVIRKKRRSLSRCQASRRRSISLPGQAIPLSNPTAWTGSPAAAPARVHRASSQSSNGRLSIYDTFVQLKVGVCVVTQTFGYLTSGVL